MADAPPADHRKIWCGVDERGEIKATHFRRDGIESLTTTWTTNGGSHEEPANLLPVLYEPAVPRCKTCIHHDVRDDEPTAFCCQWSRWLHVGDGSGHCHEHRDRRGNAR